MESAAQGPAALARVVLGPAARAPQWFAGMVVRRVGRAEWRTSVEPGRVGDRVACRAERGRVGGRVAGRVGLEEWRTFVVGRRLLVEAAEGRVERKAEPGESRKFELGQVVQGQVELKLPWQQVAK